jgi:hypothetical protein
MQGNEVKNMTLVRFLEVSQRDKEVRARLQSAIRRRDLDCASLDNALDAYGLRNMYRQAVISNPQGLIENDGVWIVDINLLASIIRSMDIQVDELIDRAPFPFSQWRPGGQVRFLLGTRCRKLSAAHQATFDALSAEDDKARTWISSELQKSLRCQIADERFSALKDEQQAEDYVSQLLDNESRTRCRHLGAIIAIGAPPTNPAAEPLARRILNGTECPFQFRWAGDIFDMARFADQPIVLSQRRNCKYEDEGIALAKGTCTELHRQRDNVVQNRADRSRSESYDCGLILMNRYNAPNRPRLFVVAGHGARATLAATYALFSSDFRECLVEHSTLSDVEYALIKVTSASDELKPFGKNRGWDFHRDILANNDKVVRYDSNV